ncbi:MAG: YdcF family protein [Candidatus Limnocylindria bacterium]
MRLIGRLVLLTTVVGGVLAAYTTYRLWDAATSDDRAPVDAIVVMGAAQYDGRPSPVFVARLDHAIALYDEGVAPLLVVTGGKAEGDRSTEAAAARAYAVAHGVPDHAIIGEDRSRTTRESIEAVAVLLREAGARRAVFVSDPTHMYRVLRLASDAGIDAAGSPTTTSPIMRDPAAVTGAVVHELGALVVDTLRLDQP